MSLVRLIEETEYRYNANVVAGLIRSNRKRYKTVRPKTRLIIYLMVNRVTQNSGISYFYNVKRNRGLDMGYVDAEDIASELFEVCDACIDVYDETRGEFFFQYHTAVKYKMRKMMSSKSSSEVSYSHINTNDTYSDEEGMENMLSDLEGERTEHDFDLSEVDKVLTKRQKNFVNKLLSLKEKPTARDFGTNQKGYISAIERVVESIENEKPRRSMDKQIFLNREFGDIEKSKLPKDGEETVVVCKNLEERGNASIEQFEVLHFRNDGQEWDYFHLGMFGESEDAIIFADAKIRRLNRKL